VNILLQLILFCFEKVSTKAAISFDRLRAGQLIRTAFPILGLRHYCSQSNSTYDWFILFL